MSALRRPTNRDGQNVTITPYTDSGAVRSCGRCLKHKPQAGGSIHPRTRLWNCAGCTAMRLVPKESS
jgi:flavoprotein